MGSPLDLHKLQLIAVALLLGVGGALALAGQPVAADWLWAIGTALVLVPTLWESARSVLRGDFGVDLIALLAMAGALALGEHLAAVIIALMLVTGGALERYAAGRAERELTALLARAPRTAHRKIDGRLEDVDVDAVAPGDVLVVKSGEVIPADGVLLSDAATLDASALTGESRLVQQGRGDRLRSGATNQGAPFDLRVTAAAADSTYAGIIRLVEAAARSKAPFVRLADRYAVWFLGFTLALSGLAWALSGDAIRALAVLVVATPCPLILAAPAAIVSGVSRAARHGIIVKGGAPLEALAGVTHVLLDKTGTITASQPRVVAVEPLGDLPADTIVRLAAAADQLSVHPFSEALLSQARDRGLDIPLASDAKEEAGAGITATVEGRRVALGQLRWVAPATDESDAVQAIMNRTAVEGASSVFVSVDGQLQGALILVDPLRREAPRALHALRSLGLNRIYMVTGDHPDVAELVGDATGVDRVYAERAPQEKVEVVQAVRREGPTLMVGDGVNDAPALALADVGVAMGSRGATAASEAADVVLTADRLDSLVLGIRIARRTRRIALQSVLAGMGLSILAMVVAALGYLPPVAGAILQEGIDVVVILNALRALGSGHTGPTADASTAALGAHLEEAHRSLRPQIEGLAVLASRLPHLPGPEANALLRETCRVLHDSILPHELEEQREAFPVVARISDSGDPSPTLIRAHQEIQRLCRTFQRMVERLPAAGPSPADLPELQRVLYGLHAILTLHTAQEDALYSELAPL